MSFDLFLGVPRHRVPEVVADSGMCVDGWIPVDPVTLATRWPGVYAVGDVTSVGTPKAGVFAEGQGAVVAGEIIAMARGGSADGYEGRGVCYLEFGAQGVAVVDVTFVAGQAPFGFLDGPSIELGAKSHSSAPPESSGGSARTGDGAGVLGRWATRLPDATSGHSPGRRSVLVRRGSRSPGCRLRPASEEPSPLAGGRAPTPWALADPEPAVDLADSDRGYGVRGDPAAPGVGEGRIAVSGRCDAVLSGPIEVTVGSVGMVTCCASRNRCRR